MPAKASEIKQLSRIADGEEPAFAQLYSATSQSIYRYLMRNTGDRDQCDNLLVKSYQNAWRKAEDYDHQLQPVDWLLKIAREQLLSTDDEQVGDDEPVVDLSIAALDRQKAFIKAMDSLPVESRDALTLVLMQGYTYHQALQQ